MLLEALLLDSLVWYFQSLYDDDMCEVKGVYFNAFPNSIVLPQDYAHKTLNFNLNCEVIYEMFHILNCGVEIK